MKEPDPREVLGQLEQRARRRFGQHFLLDTAVVDRMVACADVRPGDRVVEIGPGLGILTRALLRAGAVVTAIELDRDLVTHLTETLPQVTIVSADALHFDWSLLAASRPFAIVSNLPYNVGTHIVTRLLREEVPPKTITVMLQREVVERLCAASGSRTYGSLSVDVQVRATATHLFNVSADRFHPRPKVESAVVRLDPRAEPATDGVPLAQYEEVVRHAFAQRRKTLVNALTGRFGRERVSVAVAGLGWSPTIRAEAVDIAGFAKLTGLLLAAG